MLCLVSDTLELRRNRRIFFLIKAFYQYVARLLRQFEEDPVSLAPLVQLPLYLATCPARVLAQHVFLAIGRRSWTFSGLAVAVKASPADETVCDDQLQEIQPVRRLSNLFVKQVPKDRAKHGALTHVVCELFLRRTSSAHHHLRNAVLETAFKEGLDLRMQP